VIKMVAIVILAVLVAIAAAAPRYGVDSRNGIGTRRASPLADLRAVGHALSRSGRRVRR
jgi:hypothetical protein